MESKTAEAIGLKHGAVAIMFTDEKPEDATQFREGRFGCVMSMLAAATRGKTAVFDRKTFGCPGGGTGLGFGNQYPNFPGGMEFFCRFLSVGNRHWEPGMQIAEQIKPFVNEEIYDDFVNGEAYVRTPELVMKFVECLPIVDLPCEYVVFRPLHEVDPELDKPEVVVFLADADQIAGLVVLANYDRDDNENVIIPHAAGCQSIGIYAYREASRELPRAVVGLTDPSARVQIKRQLKDDLLSFAMPFAMFKEMEANVPGSFLERNTWRELMGLRQRG